ncbi:glutathione-binding protein GsiB precursor [Peptococcaceae bacterium CEB3]|nr:glutathione-binding protein GsiB precursor [Peptococcaceae bacterium CEB3]
MVKKSMMLVCALLFGLSLILSGCGAPAGKTVGVQSVQKQGKSITVAVQDNFVSMDPGDTNDTLSFSAEKTMMEGLIGFDKSMKMVPLLATSWEVSPDAKEFTFHLRKGVKFSDGTPFNAQAVKVNIDRLSDPKSNLKRHSLFSLVDKTVVVDEYTVKVILKQPFGAMLNNFAHPAALMVSPAALEKYGKNIGRHPVGTGEYMLKEWIPGDHLTVVKNPNYWRQGYPKLDSITFKSVPENGSRIAMLQTGEADFIYPVPPENVQSLVGQSGVTVKHKPSIIVDYVSMNTLKKPFNDPKVRQALNYAIDKNAFIKVVYSGLAEPMTSEIASNVQFFSPQQPYPYDPNKAKALLKEAGYPNGFDTTIWSNNNSTYIKATQFIQQQLAQVGVKVKIENMESGTMDSKIWSVKKPQDATIQLYFGGWSPSTGDADWGLRPLLSKDMIPPQGYNTAYYQNDTVSREIQQAIETADPAQRKAAYDKVEKDIWQDAPWVFLDTRDNIYGYRNYLKDAFLLPDGSLDVQKAEIVK